MQKRWITGMWALILVACAGPSASAPAPTAQDTAGAEASAGPLENRLPHGAQPEPGVYTSGAVSEADLDAVAAAGVRTVIDLRTAKEKKFDEAAAVEARGMNYVSIEVPGPAGLTHENVDKLDAALKGEGPFLVHCGSSNRTGALFALRAAWIEGKDMQESLAIGAAHGLSGLESLVRQMLE